MVLFTYLKNFGKRAPAENKLMKYHGEPWHTPKGRMIRDAIYAVDTGLITTVSFLAGVSYSMQSSNVVVLSLSLQVTAGVIAIFFGSYISTKAQKDFFEAQISREKREIEECPEREKEEIREIFSEMGFDSEEQEMCVRRITSNKDIWLKFMIQEEIGLVPGTLDNPLEIAVISSLGYLTGAFVPLNTFIFLGDTNHGFMWSVVAVLLFLFFIGIFKTKLTKVNWLKSAIETTFAGALSAAAGYGLGYFATILLK